MTNDVSKQLDKLINKIQETSTYYLMQDNQISSSHKLKIAVVISLLLIAGSLIFMSSMLTNQSQTNLRMIARYQIILLYSENTVSVQADYKKTTNTKLGWPEFAKKNGGVDNVVLLTQQCDDSYLPWKPVTCNFIYQTIFNNGKASERYGIELKEKGNDTILELHNASAGATHGKPTF
ncbi:hypothetical protein [Vibrio salinus]|uniref:hypothetical protein n=1 Tax=Vibrio salinus TaxID=2899784 RepID=UPI001E622083|nr:hypothetical protein [Vibrio salinus]MCE0495529.1 hypothetical protein [Vibrio salinus]